MNKKTRIFRFILALYAWLPLPIIHMLGVILGWIVHLLSRNQQKLIRENIRQSGIAQDEKSYKKLVHQNVAESGKAFLETFAIWMRDQKSVLGWVKGCEGWHHVEAARADGKGIIFLTPHMGCFEITSIFYGSQLPITVLYRPPRQAWVMPLIEQGRQRGQVKLAPTNAKGVRDLMQALKRGEAIGILPDQVPAAGEGDWANYFGRPAYTMNLASRVAQKTGAQVLIAFGERLAYGAGFRIHIQAVAPDGIATPTKLNQVIETQVKACPAQYYWNYNRYKTKPGKPPLDIQAN